jgi:hypothetical protein
MKYKYIMTAILLNIRKDGITPKSIKAAKADEDFACLNVEHDDVIVDDISACEIVQVNERILAVTYYVDVESDLPEAELISELKDVIDMNCEDEDYVLVSHSVFSFEF